MFKSYLLVDDIFSIYVEYILAEKIRIYKFRKNLYERIKW